jgi:hypothetical protein
MLHRYLHGCNVLYALIHSWANTNIIVVADSYFASVQAALRLYRVGMRFIGTVKTATTSKKRIWPKFGPYDFVTSKRKISTGSGHRTLQSGVDRVHKVVKKM